MAKTLRTSGDYTIKTGTGAGGSNTVFLDSKTTRVQGDLVVDGTRTELNTATLSVEDQFIEVNRNNSTSDTEDSGLFFNRGSSNHGLLYWDAGDDEFQLGTTTNAPTVTAITNMTLGNLAIASPVQSDHAATKAYVDSASGSFAINFTGDDSTVVAVATGNTVDIAGGTNINTAAAEPDSVTINLTNNLTEIHSITNSSTNADLELSTNGSGSIVINDILSFSANRSGDPTATAITRMWTQTPGGGGTGVYFNNTSVSSGTAGELISKSKATALAIALG